MNTEDILCSWRSLSRELMVENENLVKDDLTEFIEERQIALEDAKKDLHSLSSEVISLTAQLQECEEKYCRDSMNFALLQKEWKARISEQKLRKEMKREYILRIKEAEGETSSSDLEYLESLKKKLLAYKKLTGITWDYDRCDASQVSGYICHCKDDRKFKRFQIEAEGRTKHELAPQLWDKMEKFNKRDVPVLRQ